MNGRGRARLGTGAIVISLLAAPQAAAEPPGQDAAQAPAIPSPAASSRPLSVFVTATSAADTNINHDINNLFAYGLALGTGARYQNQPVDPSLQVDYQIAVHRYARSDRWDRLSQQLRAVFERELEGPWEIHAIGEISLKGTSEDRELSDQYIIMPRLQYRIDQWRRLRTYGTLRLRRYDDDIGRNATNRYVGVEFTQRSGLGDQWDVDVRIEHNAARDPRQTYVRWTFGAEYMTPVMTRNRVELGVKLRQQRYSHRLVEVADRDVPRRDLRWVPSVGWVRAINSHAEVRLGYTLETRASNDPRREFTAHLLEMTATRRW